MADKSKVKMKNYKNTYENKGKLRFHAATERAQDLFFNRHQVVERLTQFAGKEDYISDFNADVKTLTQIQNEYWQKHHEITLDPMLSKAGKDAEIEKIKDKAMKRISSQEALKSFDPKIDCLDVELLNRYVSRRDSNKINDPVLGYLQQEESRRYIQRLRNEKSGETKTQENGDPAQALLDEAIDNYGKETEQFITAVLEPPFPIKVIDDQVKEKAVESLKRVISPQQYEQREYLKAYRETFQVLADGAREGIGYITNQHRE